MGTLNATLNKQAPVARISHQDHGMSVQEKEYVACLHSP